MSTGVDASSEEDIRTSEISGSYILSRERCLEECKTQVGIVRTIAGPVRYQVYLRGMAEHSGATPMDMRSDALCAAAEIILEMEKIGKWESAYESVATVRRGSEPSECSECHPGQVELSVDMRGIDQDSLDRMEQAFKAAVQEVARSAALSMWRRRSNSIPADRYRARRWKTVWNRRRSGFGISSRRMPSGAGHDAMSLCGDL